MYCNTCLYGQVHYHGTLIDGSVFDSSVMRGSPISFPLNGVIKGWTEGVQLMKVGRVLFCLIGVEIVFLLMLMFCFCGGNGIVVLVQ